MKLELTKLRTMNRSTLIQLFMMIGVSLLAQRDTLSLDEAITLALRQNPNILIAANEKEIAQISDNWFAAGRIPTVALNGTYSRSLTNLNQKLSNGTEIIRNGVSNGVINANGQFSYRLYNGKRMYIVKKRLDIQAAQSDIALKQQINQTSFDVINKYININSLVQRRKAINETISFFEERSKLSQSRFEIGTAGKNDYLQSQVDLNVQRSNALSLDNDIQLAKMDLNRVMARDPFMLYEVHDLNIPDVLPTKDQMQSAIDSLNPDIAFIRYNQQILEQQNKEIKTQQLPSIFANASAAFNKSSSTAGFNLFTQNYGPQAGLTISMPLFTGPIVRQQLQINAIQSKNQALQIDNTKQALLTQAAIAYQNFENAKSLIALEEKNLEVIRENNYISMERFRKATITTVELRQAQLNLVEAQNRIINARYTLKESETQIRYIMGALVE